MSNNETPVPSTRPMADEQLDTQRATMHYVRSLAILAALFVYTSVVGAIVGLAFWGTSSADGGGAAFGALIALIGAVALPVGALILLIQFVAAFQTATNWSKRLTSKPVVLDQAVSPTVTPDKAPMSRERKRILLIIGGAVLALIAVVGVIALVTSSSGGSDNDGSRDRPAHCDALPDRPECKR